MIQGEKSCDTGGKSCDTEGKFHPPSCSSQFQSTPRTILAPEKAPRAVSFLLLRRLCTVILWGGGGGEEEVEEGGRGKESISSQYAEGTRYIICMNKILYYTVIRLLPLYNSAYRGEEGVAIRWNVCRGLCLSPW